MTMKAVLVMFALTGMACATDYEPTTLSPYYVVPPTKKPTPEPTTVEPTTVAPTPEPTTVEPTTVEPTTVEPTTKKPEVKCAYVSYAEHESCWDNVECCGKSKDNYPVQLKCYKKDGYSAYCRKQCDPYTSGWDCEDLSGGY